MEAQNCLNWAIKTDIFIIAAHISGVFNTEADEESRKSELRTEWKLNEIVFTDILDQLDFYPSVDLLASRVNTQLKRFFYYPPGLEAGVINALCVSSTIFHHFHAL